MRISLLPLFAVRFINRRMERRLEREALNSDPFSAYAYKLYHPERFTAEELDKAFKAAWRGKRPYPLDDGGEAVTVTRSQRHPANVG